MPLLKKKRRLYLKAIGLKNETIICPPPHSLFQIDYNLPYFYDFFNTTKRFYIFRLGKNKFIQTLPVFLIKTGGK
jgi:hypothetical protein